MIQGGDPTATGAGSPGYRVPDEFPEVGTPYPRGTVALGRTAAADSSGSQFFIVYGDAAGHLGTEESLLYNILGTVTDGFDVLDAIEAVPVDGQTPTEGIFIESVAITR
jgi:cyclophilin family peptidyl-prolyl cis-trans isomerase